MSFLSFIVGSRNGIRWQRLPENLVHWDPGEPRHFIDLAYATRRAESIEQAHAILTRAAALRPKDGTIQFNWRAIKRS
jgi:hypothetical protein